MRGWNAKEQLACGLGPLELGCFHFEVILLCVFLQLLASIYILLRPSILFGVLLQFFVLLVFFASFYRTLGA